MERRSPLATFLVHGAALLLGVFILAPLVWLFVMSISSTSDLTAKPLHWWPRRHRLLALPDARNNCRQ